MNKHILETLNHLIDYCETRIGKHGVVVRSDLEQILNDARESYNKAIEEFRKPKPVVEKEEVEIPVIKRRRRT